MPAFDEQVEACNNGIDEEAWATRAFISSARCVLEIEEQPWTEAQASGLTQFTNPSFKDAIPLFVQAINELEAHITIAIEQRVSMTDMCSSYTAYVRAAYPHATAVKMNIIRLGDGVELLHEAQKSPHNVQAGEVSTGRIDAEAILHSITKGLLALYDLLYREDTGVRQSLRDVIDRRGLENL